MSTALEKARQSLVDYKNRTLTKVKANEGKIQEAMHIGIGTGVAYGLGYVEGAFPDKAQVGSVPLSAIIGPIGVIAGLAEATPSEQGNSILLEVGRAALYTFASGSGRTKGAASQAA